MPSPVGHTLAGVCGFIVARPQVPHRQRPWLFFGSVFVANLPDLDILPGLLLFGDPRTFHHQASHSLMAAVVTGFLVAILAGRCNLNRIRWGLWAAGLYASHVLLDFLVDDPMPPFGVQALWPFSEAYFISPITPFAGFHYFDPELGMVRTLFSAQNLVTVLREILLMVPFVGMAWCFRKWCSKEPFER